MVTPGQRRAARRLAVAVVVAAAAVTAPTVSASTPNSVGSTATALPQKQAYWKFDESPESTSTRVRGRVRSGSRFVALNGDAGALGPRGVTRGAPAAFRFGDDASHSAYDFAGWNGCRSGCTWDGTRIDPDASAVVVPGSEPEAAVLNPSGKAFAVEVWLRPRAIAAWTLGGCPSACPTFNIVQKGLSSDRSQWKMSVDKDLRLLCRFSSRTGAVVARTRGTMSPGVDYRARCRRTPASTTRDEITAEFCYKASGRTACRRGVASASRTGEYTNGEDLWIGKKPGSTDPLDAFSGVIDNVTIYREP